MWYQQFTFFDKQEGLKNEIPNDFFTHPATDKEFEYISTYTNGKPKEDFPIPTNLKLPFDFIQLLNYSNGGGIINDKREFGYFDVETIREMYMSYGFMIWAPTILPVAFDGGGNFYAYNFNDNTRIPQVYLVPSGSIGDDESCVFLGNTLEEVLTKTGNVADELDILYPKIELTESQKNHKELQLKLSKLKDDKNSGKINLKDYLIAKRETEEQLKILESKK